MKRLPLCYAPPTSPRDQVRHAAMDKIPIILRLTQAARDTLFSSPKVRFFVSNRSLGFRWTNNCKSHTGRRNTFYQILGLSHAWKISNESCPFVLARESYGI